MARGAAARLFVAVDPPPEVCEELAEWAREATADWRSWTVRRPHRPHRPPRLLKADSLHLTLCFLGSRPVGEIDALGAALGMCGEHAAELSVGAPLWLPPRRPRALAVEVRDGTGALAVLAASVASTLSQASGWEPERRRFRPHVTLARMRDTAGSPLPPTPQLRFTAREIVLYRSMPAAGGTAYDPLASCELAPADA
jgi:RNA 2',3'-cyclic 3'-phosphodiesterase